MRKLLFGLAFLSLSTATSAVAQNWPAWRGPTGDGLAAADAAPPLTWSESEHVRWKVPLPGIGASTPIVWGDRIFLTTAIPSAISPGEEGQEDGAEADSRRAQHEFVVLAFARRSGELLWQTAVAARVPHEGMHRTSTYASASIVTDGERLVAFFGSNGLYCLDLDGALLWSKDLGQQRVLQQFGEGASPALHDGIVVVPWDHEGASFVVALDASTGEERWRQERETGSSWGTPLVTPVGEASQVILTGSGTTWAYDLASGEPVWQCDGMSANPVIGPTLADGVVYVTNSYKGHVTQAISLAAASGEVAPDELLWTHARNASYVPCPIVVAGNLFFLRDSTGVLSCLDARTGEVRFEGQRLGFRRAHASPVAAAGRLYFTARDGMTVVVKASDEFEVLATNQLDDVFDASPVAVADELLLRGREHLYCIAAPEER
ncbi:MAG: PQQ-binding-like beta-propeller repeat protein [Planctomycetota bacterium]